MEQTEVIFSKYASVLLDEVALEKPLDYGIPEEKLPFAKKGSLVEVPMRGKLRKGFILEVKETSEFPKVLPLHTIIGEEIPQDLFELAVWIGRYYCAPLRHVLRSLLPATIRRHDSHKEQYFVTRAQTKEVLREACINLRNTHTSQAQILDILLQAKKGMLLTELLEKAQVSKSPVETLEKKGLIAIEKVVIHRSPLEGEEYFKTEPKVLNAEQQEALGKLTKALDARVFETHLLFGITGSGKTEVYLQIIEKALAKGLSTIMLVPEISLTAQTIERFRSRFEENIAILHHRLSEGQRFDEWQRIRRGDAKIVIGARSALFSPVKNLGLLIVDEEHEGAYKQSDEQPCYHARDVAVMRGKLASAVVVLGSATPSLESYDNALKGKYVLSKLHHRATKATLAPVTIVDMKREFEKAGGYTSFSEPLIEGIKKRFKDGEQTLLFLNRRGYHTSRSCQKCGYIFKCPHCDLALTFHLKENHLTCHLCDFRLSPPPRSCPECKCVEHPKFHGVGTEQIEKALHALFPEIRTLRIDGDTTRHKGSHEKLLREFSTGKADVLIGTQMITKGLHFPAVTLVAVLNSDSGLHIPDFRASEHIFQLITQVAGRSGRGHLPGEVIIQTHIPDNPTILLAAEQNYEKFFESEIESRKLFGFPPFTHLIKLTFSGEDADVTHQTAALVRDKLIKGLGKGYLVHPVVPSGHAKIKNLFRFQCLIRGMQVYPAVQLLQHLKQVREGVKLHIDVDPLSTYF